MLRRKLRSKTGSVLVLAVTMVTVLTLIGFALVSVTFSVFQTAISGVEQNTSYFAIEAGMGRIMSALDRIVGNYQETAKQQATDEILADINQYRSYDGSYVPDFTSEEFQPMLNTKFETLLKNYFGGLDGSGSINATLSKQQDLFGLTEAEKDTAQENGKPMIYVDIDPENKRKVTIESCLYDDVNQTLTIYTKSVYNGYNKFAKAVYSLKISSALFQPTKSLDTLIEPPRHEILKKALVAEKNIFAYGGNVQIVGDVLGFGTIEDENNDGFEDSDAQWYQYGGILVGMQQKFRNQDFLYEKFGIAKNDLIASPTSGSLTVTGNVATMGYVNVLYSNKNQPSSVTVNGKTYARSVLSSVDADKSLLNFEDDLIITDSLTVDSNDSEVTVKKKLLGVVENGYEIAGEGANNVNLDPNYPQNSSNMVVTGDSTITFGNNADSGIYLGGSTFFKDLKKDGFPYMTGIAGIKATGHLTEVFEKGSESTDSTLYWYEAGNTTSIPWNGLEGNLSNITWSSYTDLGPPVDTYYMMTGIPSNNNFSIEKRGRHFKQIWEQKWKNNEDYSQFLSFSNIKANSNIKNNQQKIKGFSRGALTLRIDSDAIPDKVYDESDFSDYGIPFANTKIPTLEQFHNQIKGLLQVQTFNSNYPKLNFVKPTKFLNDTEYRNPKYTDVSGGIQSDIIYNKGQDGFVYYNNSGNTILIYRENGIWKIKENGQAQGTAFPLINGTPKGIIVVDGNLMIDDGFVFKGIIMSRKNIVFKGNATITYDDETIQDPFSITKLLQSDVIINGFFGLLKYELSDIINDTKKSQRLVGKAVSLESFNQVDRLP